MNGPGVTPPIWPVGPSGGRPGGRPGGRLGGVRRGVRRWWRGRPGLPVSRQMAWRLGALTAGVAGWAVVFGLLLQLTGGQPGIPVVVTVVVGWFGVWSPFLSQTSVGMRVAQCNWTVSGEFLPESALLNEIDVSRHAGVERGHERAGLRSRTPTG